MKPLIDRAIWFVTGGKEPLVHTTILRRRKSSIQQMKIPQSKAMITLFPVWIETKINRFYSRININRMAVECIRPVQSIFPFHLVGFPVHGFNLPTLSILTRIKKFTPNLVVNYLKMGISLLVKEVQTALQLTTVRHEKYSRIESYVIHVPTIQHRIKTMQLNPRDIPYYFIRIRSVSTFYIKPVEIASRKIAFAKALGLPITAIQLLAIFKDVEKFSHEKIKFDERTNSLICHVDEDDKNARICDVLVGRNLHDNKLHIILYKH